MALLRPFALTAAAKPLQLDVFTSDESSYGVTSTVIYGETEAILIDAQMHTSQAEKLAARIEQSGRRLKAIFVTHPDVDHYMGLGTLHARFPGAPIYMTAASLEEFQRSSAKYLARQRANAPAETPESLPTPEVLPSTVLDVDGASVLILKDLQGDVLKPTNSLVWIPSLRAIVAGDVVFDGVHPWLADSDVKSRAAWRVSLDLVEALHPQRVVPGHQQRAAGGVTPNAVAFMRRYLADFEEGRRTATTADQLVAWMKRRHAGLGQEKFLDFAARAAFPAGDHP